MTFPFGFFSASAASSMTFSGGFCASSAFFIGPKSKLSAIMRTTIMIVRSA